MCPDLFSGEALVWFNSCKQPTPVSDHSVLTFWVAACGRFDCIIIIIIITSINIIHYYYCDYDNNVDLMMLLIVNSYNERNN